MSLVERFVYGVMAIISAFCVVLFIQAQANSLAVLAGVCTLGFIVAAVGS